MNFQNIRGNLNTRLKKLQSGEYDAIVLAQAGYKIETFF
jgi:hydroxymethylbilane synthase